MFSYNAIGSYVLVLTLATLLVLVIVWRTHRRRIDLPLWLMAGIIGILLGASCAVATAKLMNYNLVLQNGEVAEEPEDGNASGLPGEGGAPGGGAPGGGAPGGGAPGGGRGRFTPSAKRQLSTLVRKLELLTGDVAIKLSDKQASDIVAALAKIEESEKMTDDDAKATYDKLLGLLDEKQKAKQEAISLATRRGGGRGRGAPGGGRPGGGASGRPGGASGRPGGAGQDEDANPFQQESNKKALTSLRERFSPAENTPSTAKKEEVEEKKEK